MERIWILSKWTKGHFVKTRWINGHFLKIISVCKLYATADDLREKLKKEEAEKYDYKIELFNILDD